jgi:acyl dehydratase
VNDTGNVIGTSPADDGELPEWTLDRVDPEKMKLLALLLADPNPLHFDPVAAQRLGVADRPVNQGPSNMAMLANLLRMAFPDGRLARLRVQLRGNVVADDKVRAHGRIRSTERSGNEEILHCEVSLEVAGRGTGATGDADVIRFAGELTLTQESANG